MVNYLWIEGTLAWSGFKNKIIKLSWTEVPFAGKFWCKGKMSFFPTLIYIHSLIHSNYSNVDALENRRMS